MEEQNQNSQTQYQSESGQKNIAMAVIAYILFFVPLLTESKNDPFVKYHIKQGLVLFLASFISMIVYKMPVIQIFVPILNVALLVLFIVGIINAVNGKEKPLPIIGKFADNFKF